MNTIIHIYKTTSKHKIYDISIEKENQLFKLPSGLIVHNSPFTNVSLLGPDSLRGIMGNYLWGLDTKIDDLIDEIMVNQQIYTNFLSKGQLGSDRQPIGIPYRFPITTFVADPSFMKEYPEAWDEILLGNSNLCYLNILNSMGENLKSLALCCRLTNSIEDLLKINVNNTFGSFLQVGSHAVVSINLPRMAYETKDETKFLEVLQERCEIARQLLKIHREEILGKRRLKYHYFFNKGYLDLKRNFFSTIGFIGIANALEMLGMKITESSGLEFAKRILKVIKDKTVEFTQKDDYMYNLEEVPAESASGTLATKDKILCKGTYDYYDSQFIPLSYDINLFDRIRTEGGLQEYCTGGSISHLNLDGRPNDDSLLNLTNKILNNSKLRHFAFNMGFTVCKSGHTTVGIHKKCLSCNTEELDWITRTVGYFTPVSAWNRAKQLEFKNRRWNSIN